MAKTERLISGKSFLFETREFILSNTYATFEAQLIKKLRNTKTELKKSVGDKQKCVYLKASQELLESTSGVV